MTNITFDTTKTAKISGSGQLSGEILKKFASAIPDNAVISLKESKTSSYPGEYGRDLWSITATWKENNE